RALMPCAEAMETAARQFCDQAATLTRGLTGSLRLTSSEVLANLWLAPAMVEFRQHYPDIDLELIASDRFLDLGNGEADIAVRASAQPTDPGCVVRKLTSAPWAIFCSVDYAQKHGRPADPRALNDHMLIGGVDELENLPAMRWIGEVAPRARIHCRSNSLQNLYYSVKAGLGVAPLPTTMGDGDPALVRCSEDIKELEASVWLITPERLRDTPRVRAFIDFLAPYMARTRPAPAREKAPVL
ncbi:MAG TPA: substrate binding domain-containing protein, partial [Caulobacteraceae bacterium]|nr:substrate binding domain-containing protein [Caulobacteraceae bacterium]